MATTVKITTNPQYGSVTWNGLKFIYTPNVGFTGTDCWTYIKTVNGVATTSKDCVTTTNKPLTASNITLNAIANKSQDILIDSYYTDDGLMNSPTVVYVGGSTYGTFAYSGNKITYLAAGFNGTESVIYTLSDGQYQSTANINLSVSGGKDCPTGVPNNISSLYPVFLNAFTVMGGNTANWNSVYNTVNTLSTAWNALNLDLYNTYINIIRSNSANWNISYDYGLAFIDQSNNNVELYNLIKSHSAIWDIVPDISQYEVLKSIIISQSANWFYAYSSSLEFSAQSANNINSYNLISSNSANWAGLYNLVASNSTTWNLVPDTGIYDAISNIVSASSSSWNNAYTAATLFSAQSADNINLYNVVCANSTVWGYVASTSAYDNAVSILSSSSANWDSGYNAYSTFSEQSANNINLYNVVCANSTAWAYVPSTSLYETATNVLTSNSASWDSAYTATTLFSTQSANNNNLYSVVCSNSSEWAYVPSTSAYDLATSVVTSNSANWDFGYTAATLFSAQSADNINLYNTVCANSTVWAYIPPTSSYDLATSIVSSNSASWNDSYSATILFSAQSADNINLYNVVCANSTVWAYIPPTSSYDLATSIVSSNSASWDSAYNSFSTFSAQSADNINLYNVVCANSTVWAYIPPTSSYDLATSIITANSGNWNEGYTAATLFSAQSADNVNLYNVVCANSTVWSYIPPTSGYDLATSLVTSNSASWDSAYTAATLFSAQSSNNINLYNVVCANSTVWSYIPPTSSYDLATSIVSTNSGNWNDAYIATILFSAQSADNINLYNTVCANSTVWAYIPPTSSYDLATSIITANSGSWDEGYSTAIVFSSQSANYINLYNIISTNSASWAFIQPTEDYNIAYNIITSSSSNWNSMYASSLLFSEQSANNIDLYNVVQSSTGLWNYIQPTSTYDIAYNIVSGNSASWNEGYNSYLIFSAQSANNLINSTIISENSGSWNYIIPLNDYDTILNVVTSSSAGWESMFDVVNAFASTSANNENLYNLVTEHSAVWEYIPDTAVYDSAVSLMNSYSGNWNTGYDAYLVYAVNSGRDETLYNTVCANSANWSYTAPTDLYNLALTYVSANSANWDSSYATSLVFSGQSANNIALYNLLCANSTVWSVVPDLTAYDNAKSLVQFNSAFWSYAANQDDLYADLLNTIQTNSAFWNSVGDSFNYLNLLTATWDASYNTISTNSAKWDGTYADLISLSSYVSGSSIDWDSAYNTVSQNSAKWSDGYSIANDIQSNSANWQSTYTDLCANSASWNALSANFPLYDEAYSVTNTQSSYWNNSYNLVSSLQNNWNDVLSTIQSLSSDWLSGDLDVDFYANSLTISGDAVIYGNVSAAGGITHTSTVVDITSSLSIINQGNIDAITVEKTVTGGSYANFNYNGSPVFYINGDGNVGVNTYSPNEKLTVVGNISASGNIYGTFSPEYFVYQSLSSKYDTSYNYVKSTSAFIIDITSRKSIYDLAVTFISSNSAAVTESISAYADYSDAYNVVSLQSANNIKSYSAITTLTATSGIDTAYRSNSANYESAYQTIKALSSSSANAQINYIFDGGGAAIPFNTYGNVILPVDGVLKSCTLIADTACSVSVDILSSSYTNYPTFSAICSTKPSLNNQMIRSITDMTGWNVNLSAGTILKFNLLSNTVATNLTVSLMVTKS